MPSDSGEGEGEGEGWIQAWLAELKPASVLDVGAGSGAYGRACRRTLPGAFLVALEVWQPCLERYGLYRLYDAVLLGDARALPLPSVDVVLLDDVLQCVTAVEAVGLWDRARRAARLGVLASLPVTPRARGADGGNPHDRHVTRWSHELALARLPGVAAHGVDRGHGVYLAGPAAGHGRRVNGDGRRAS